LKLWEAAPTPADALRLRASQVEKLLKGHRIRRIGVAEVIGVLKQAAGRATRLDRPPAVSCKQRNPRHRDHSCAA